ncbi:MULTISPECIES: hypothetical protein [Bacillus]|uniref:hypothetical protein n=1 Tax=Bacillus TaxID=1386 RepID=UPI00031C5826|nr:MULTISPECIES: hypothetical protein [Bacillus]
MKKKNINIHNEVYLKTVVCLFSSIRYFSHNMQLIFFVNDIQKLQQLQYGYYIQILNKLHVEIIEVSSEFVDTTKPWAGYAQFCEFGRHNTWLEDFLGLNIEKENEFALPYGGEFFYLNTNTMIPFFERFFLEYNKNENFYHTEEHYFTTIFNSEEFLVKKSMEVNPFFKRVIRANKSLDDQYLWGIYFPGEKDYKLKYLFNSLSRNNFVFSQRKAKQILRIATFFRIFPVIGKVMKGIYR